MVRLSYLPDFPAVDVGFIDVTYTVTLRKCCKANRKTILKGVSGLFRSGDLTAIIGPSGSGKSSLMNILAGYRTSNMTGTLLLNGCERNSSRFRKLSCYIMQDDCLMSHLSVKEAMLIAAALKLDKRKSLLEKKLIINDILQAIGLSDAADTKTFNLSGGQRKRLSIALELVNNPPVMFLDEPTSGLDSSSCFQLLSLLELLVRGGRNIICTIHQPSARLFEKFDHLYILADGQCIYRGSRNALVPFFASFDFRCPSYHNPADFVLEVASGEYGEAVQRLSDGINAQAEKPIQTDFAAVTYAGIFDCYRIVNQSDDNLSDTLPTIRIYQRGFIVQFWILLKRSFKTSIRNKQLMHMRILSHIIVGCFIGMIFYNVGQDLSKSFDNLGCIFFTTLFITFTGMMPTILTFPMEMGVFIRENLNSWYSIRAFYFAKTFADIPFQILFTGVYVVAMYYLTGQPLDSDRAAKFAAICILTSLVSQSLGLLIGAGLSIEAGVFIGPVSNVPIILFSGFLVRFDTIPFYLRWLTYVSYIRYGFEGAVLAIYKDRRPDERSVSFFSSSKALLEEYSMDDKEYWLDAIALLGIFLFLRIVAYIVLKVKVFSLQ